VCDHEQVKLDGRITVRWSAILLTTRSAAENYRENRPSLRLALGHDRRWRFSFAFSDANAARHTHSNESCDESDEKFLHLTPRGWKMANLRPKYFSRLVLKSHSPLKSPIMPERSGLRAAGMFATLDTRRPRGPPRHSRSDRVRLRRSLDKDRRCMTASSSWECSSRWTRAGMRFFALSLIISVTTSTTSLKGTGDHDEWSV
jgi:hypothetical protein